MAHFSIQAGTLKHLQLIFNPEENTRPTKSIVRGSFFDTLGADIIGSVFIEAFGGCGSMGIEALSRGAREAIFYEIDKKAYEILSRNLCLAQKRVKTLQFRSFNADFFIQPLEEYMRSESQVVLYLDPPFCIRAGKANIYERLITKICNLDKTGKSSISLIVFEHWSEYNMPHIIGRYKKLKMRQFGKTTLTYYVVKD
ncbi:16S rRNA (guanine(966)-N(2))-methyltransferase RsmD [Helicobacter japonicus]|uniref:16S rRNA (guanine(966)-N(2))-methyltransferase RsmD n=1 Tax=Helicobacter japonicus TaxID=425400 RepID=UPI0023F32CAA|nr:16S rRNA (guanine(966)-N(2))-methyltransferase RsmD [Helicobacter japonicus]